MSDISVQIQLLCTSFMLLLVPWAVANKTPARRLIAVLPCLGALVAALSSLFHRPILAPISETNLVVLTLAVSMIIIINGVIFFRGGRMTP